MRVDSFFIKLDEICDYIPFVSTISNLVDLFQKHVVHTFKNSEDIKPQSYRAHIHNKDTSRSVTLLVPVLGNIVVAIKDSFKKQAHTAQTDKQENPRTENSFLNFLDIDKILIGLSLDHQKTIRSAINDIENNKIGDAIEKAKTIKENYIRSNLFYLLISTDAAINNNFQHSVQLIHELLEDYPKLRSEALLFLSKELFNKKNFITALDLLTIIPMTNMKMAAIAEAVVDLKNIGRDKEAAIFQSKLDEIKQSGIEGKASAY